MERYSLVNQKFGRLTVIKLDHTERRKNRKENLYFYLCKCDCGNEIIVLKSNLIKGLTKSCGCYQIEVATKNLNKINVKHGFSRHDGTKEKLYNVWHAIKDRCNNQNNTMYKYYGGRGISVYEEWEKDYVSFRKWAFSNGYKVGLEIDRIDNNGNYEPNNCRWVEHLENLNNRRNTVKVVLNGEKYTIQELARKYNINPHTIYKRYKRGKTNEELIRRTINN